jgi:GNAT superfamily N-acetyltransferase
MTSATAGGAGHRDDKAGDEPLVRRASAADALTVATLLDAFNREFDTPTPGVAWLATRLGDLLAGEDVVVLLVGEPAVGVAVISLRLNVWYPGPVALLDELYVAPDRRGRRLGHALLEATCAYARERGSEVLEINVDGDDVDARRFYEAHGFANTEPGQTEPMYYYYRELGG